MGVQPGDASASSHCVQHTSPTSENETSGAMPDFLAGLWQEATFSYIPNDAPQEFNDCVLNVDNPCRVLAVHRASRQHGFHSLVDLYVRLILGSVQSDILQSRFLYQLRAGCGHPRCSTSTCFTYRLRIVGNSPIRQYSSASARALAVYLASLENPYKDLCCFLRRSTTPPATSKNLYISTQNPPATSDRSVIDYHSLLGKSELSSDHTNRVAARDGRKLKESLASCGPAPIAIVAGKLLHASPNKLQIHELDKAKDHRSFAVSIFSTVAFKMTEWATPHGIRWMSQKLAETKALNQVADRNPRHDQGARCSNQNLSSLDIDDEIDTSTLNLAAPMDQTVNMITPNHWVRSSIHSHSANTTNDSIMHTLPSSAMRMSSLDHTAPCSVTLSSKRLPSRENVCNAAETPRDMVCALRDTTWPSMPSPDIAATSDAALGTFGVTDVASPAQEGLENNSINPAALHRETSAIDQSLCQNKKASAAMANVSNMSADISVMNAFKGYSFPQSIPLLSIDFIDLICNTFPVDKLTDGSCLAPPMGTNTIHKPMNTQNPPQKPAATGRSNKTKWKTFNEQIIFDILSNPKSLVKSFQCSGQLYDSQTLWYCMDRMIRLTPGLVLHSLWLASKELFLQPRVFGHSRSNNAPRSNKHERTRLAPLHGSIMAICLHALVAAASGISDEAHLNIVSRTRSRGLVMANEDVASSCRRSLSLTYDDAFSDELALRLARRLFCAIVAQDCFAEIAKCDTSGCSVDGEFDVLQLLFHQLQSHSRGITKLALKFSARDRMFHHGRTVILLLEWAKTILIREWDGRAFFSYDGAFAGAMVFLKKMWALRDALQLSGPQFIVEYFAERLDAVKTPVAWVAYQSRWQRQHLLDFPFVFNCKTLVSYFRAINLSRMSRKFEEAKSLSTRMGAIIEPSSFVKHTNKQDILNELLDVASSRYLVLGASRDNLIQDAFNLLWQRQERELLRPMKIHLGEAQGEEGFDSGGVQQEFFRIAIADCLDPKYGGFSIDQKTRMTWFVPGSLMEEWKFELVGLLASLAIFNGLTLPVTFPKALYQKLLGFPVRQLNDIADGWPELSSGLSELLEWNEERGLVEEVFFRTYEFSFICMGRVVSYDMRDTGTCFSKGTAQQQSGVSEAPTVNHINREDFVRDYIHHLVDLSIQPQYLAFERGFRACLDAKSLSLLSPPLLQSLVEGTQIIDVLELKRHARYVGWDASHQTVKDFWSIVRDYNEEMKRKLLEFVTASDRVPVGGSGSLQLTIQRNGEYEITGGRLPTAYTCFGILLLPTFREKETMKEKLSIALDNAKGFGMP